MYVPHVANHMFVSVGPHFNYFTSLLFLCSVRLAEGSVPVFSSSFPHNPHLTTYVTFSKSNRTAKFAWTVGERGDRGEVEMVRKQKVATDRRY